MTSIGTLGFIGLGVMGEPMCRNLATRSGLPVIATDLRAGPLARLASVAVDAATDLSEIAARADMIFLSLPGGDQLELVCGRLLELLGEGRTVVDCSTAPVALTREMAAAFEARGVAYADAPVARTRAAAEAGTLAAMVGADDDVFAAIKPYLGYFASQVSHVGGVGAGQVAKLMNNMILIESMVAMSEALTVARRAGIDGARLFETLMTGSADSFALRNHGLKALLPGDFPEQAFSARYALKDLTYAIALARENGIATPGADAARGVLEAVIEAGRGDAYYPVLLEAIDRGDVLPR
jgi:3-hydroxyisobutyrate dehydrogenase-like beta-hydroxyacid dehydrogenase